MVEKIIIEGPIVKKVTRIGNGSHVVVPAHWAGKTVRVTIIDEQPEPPLKTKKEVKSTLDKFERNVKSAARLARKNINYSPKESD